MTMKIIKKLLFAVLLTSCMACSGKGILVECEFFDDRGGWVQDKQFYDQVGSAYLMAHGLGSPVRDASTRIMVTAPGEYNVWVRTFNWNAPWDSLQAPGRFNLLVNGKVVGGELGTAPEQWGWVRAGKVNLEKGESTLTLHDLTGFDGRCDAIYLTRDENPEFPDRTVTKADVREKEKYDLIVVGAGTAGISAAAGASRLGMKVLLLDEKYNPGGVASSEINVVVSGMVHGGKYPALGRIICEYGEPRNNRDVPGKLKADGVDARFNCRVVSLRKSGSKIKSLIYIDYNTGKSVEVSGKLYADCTGDGNVGYMAGADFRMGPEARSEFGEDLAPEVPDGRTFGSSVRWSSEKKDSASSFPECGWAVQFTDSTCQKVTKGRWNWECGFNRNQIAEAEYMRDYMFRVIYGNWAFLKNSPENSAQYAADTLVWLSPVLGKRESRRLLGDVIFTQNDVFAGGLAYPDAAVWCTYPIDQHFANPKNKEIFGEDSFLSAMKHCYREIGTPRKDLVAGVDYNNPYMMPYRCFYSRNVDNLYMAGRDVSGTRIAMCSFRVQGSTSLMGEVVAIGASIAHKYGCTPREVYTQHLSELTKAFSDGIPAKYKEIFTPDN